MSTAYSTHCDVCGRSYSTSNGQSYDPKNYPGTGWARVLVEGTDSSGATDLCRACAEPLRRVLAEILLRKIT